MYIAVEVYTISKELNREADLNTIVERDDHICLSASGTVLCILFSWVDGYPCHEIDPEANL